MIPHQAYSLWSAVNAETCLLLNSVTLVIRIVRSREMPLAKEPHKMTTQCYYAGVRLVVHLSTSIGAGNQTCLSLFPLTSVSAVIYYSWSS